jgi:hypothetical protein
LDRADGSFNIAPPDSVAVGTFNAVQSASGPGEIEFELTVTTPTEYDLAGAESGTVEITRFDSGGFACTFAGLTFNGGADTVNGGFDVTWDLYEGAPF